MTLDWIHSPTPAVTWPDRYKWRLRWFEREPLGGFFAHDHPVKIDWIRELVDVLRNGPRESAAVLALDWYCPENGFELPESGIDCVLDLRGITLCPECIPDLGDLRGLNLADCRLEGAEFNDCDLSGALLGSSCLKACLFDSCELRHASMVGADLEGTYFLCCDLRGSDFYGTNLALVEFNDCRIAAADFTGASFTRLETSGRALPDNIALVAPIFGEFRASAVFRSCEHDPTIADRLQLAWEQRSVKPLLVKPKANFTDVALEGVDWLRARRLQKYIWEQQYVQELRNWSFGHPLRRLGLLLWWFSSDYGRSISRWLFVSVLICATFGLMWEVVDASTRVPEEAMWGRPLCRAAAGVPVTAFTPFYFSIVAYTTLGFGDLVPANGSGQIALAIEVMCGYIALGVLLSIVARRVIADV